MLPIVTLGAWYVSLFMVMFILVCLFLMLVILIQKPRGGGLSGAFGGAGGSATSVFGAKTGDVLTWFTVVCFALFLLLAMLLTWTGKPTELPVQNILGAPSTEPEAPAVPPATPGAGDPEPAGPSAVTPIPAPAPTPVPAPTPAPTPAPAPPATP